MKSFILLVGISLVVIMGLGLLSLIGNLTTKPLATGTQMKQIEPTNSTLSMEQAKRIAQESDCMNEGILSDTYVYNDYTKTWWFDMEIDKEGCAPACVVDEKSAKAEINWRCTGAITQ